ncbi:MAG: 50S ribosomal protein L15 [Rickettsiales bacterium]|nr:50S ribosomal protein L15 [Rickettsiales bacterium]MDG4546220.1 50S ribosomal protein L15 [Rickettsiales bacterium]MDG4548410.1 50S ribosomal protein L15 [Rickettsiales bacterium]
MTTIKLNEINNESAPKKNRKRVGRGIGSGKGKTCGRGHKGQKSRTGVSINGFEGGQMPIYRRVPKRGFNNIHRVEYQVINVGELQKFVESKKISAAKTVTKQSLYEAGILKTLSAPFKVLAKGELKESLKIEADAASETAIKIVEKAGGKITVKA